MKKIQLNIFNQDFKDFISALNAAKVDYILVGGYSVIHLLYFFEIRIRVDLTLTGPSILLFKEH